MLDDFVTSGDVMYAQFKQDNAIEMTMRSFLQIAWSLSEDHLTLQSRQGYFAPKAPKIKK